MSARVADTADVVGSADSALADDGPIGRYCRREALGRLNVGLEGAEVSVVDADNLRANVERGIELLLVVYLDLSKTGLFG